MSVSCARAIFADTLFRGRAHNFLFLHLQFLPTHFFLCVGHKFLGPFFHLQFLPTLFLGGEHNFLSARLQFLPTVDKFLRPISSVAVGLCVQHNMYHRISNILDLSHVSLFIIFLDLRFKNNWILRNKITVAMSKNSDDLKIQKIPNF